MILMAFSFVLLFFNMCMISADKKDRTERFIYSSCLWCLFLYVATELLSIGNHLNRNSVLTSWCLFTFGLFVWSAYLIKTNRVNIFSVASDKFISFFKVRNNRILSVIFIAYSCIVIFFALKTIPYDSDSMVYHLSRVFYWAKNESVAHFATSNWRMIASTPFAEFINLHIYLLKSCNDGILNLVQAISFIISIFMVYRIATIIGCDKRARVLAAVLFATLPIAFAESSTTQNDDVSAMWLLFFVYIMIRILNDNSILDKSNGGHLRMIMLGMVLGFGYLVKPTFVPAAGVFTVWILVCLIINKTPIRTIVYWVAGTILSVLVVVSPEIIRNLVTFHAISYYGVGARQMIGTLRPSYVFVNFLKVLFVNLPAIYWPNVYWRFPGIVYKVGSILGVNVDDETISETGLEYFIAQPQDHGCGTAVNFLMAILVIIFLIYHLVRIVRRKEKVRWGYSSSAFAAFILIQFIVRWEPYLVRYMIGYFALLSPAIAIQLQKIGFLSENGNYKRGLATGTILFVTLIESVSMIDDKRQDIAEYSVMPLEQQYFLHGMNQYEELTAIADVLNQMGDVKIGVDLMEGTLEYPLMYMIDGSISELKCVNVSNSSVMYEDMSYVPDCILYRGPIDDSMLSNGYECHGVIYTNMTKISDSCCIFIR